MFTSSAHPSFALAALDKNAHAHIYLNQVSDHSQKHGYELLQRILLRKYISGERSRETAEGVKRLRSEDISFISVDAPTEQLLFFEDAIADPQSAWRSGLNHYPTSEELETLVPNLVRFAKAAAANDFS